jgi:hypothetical protein
VAEKGNPDPVGTEAALSRAASAYYHLVLVVGIAGAGKTALLRAICDARGWPLVNLGLEVSRRLLTLTRERQTLEAADIIADVLDAAPGTAAAVDNTEIIFDPSLRLNPQGLLETVSRRRTLVWSCPGRLDGDELVYAYPGHPEYRRLRVREFATIEL